MDRCERAGGRSDRRRFRSIRPHQVERNLKQNLKRATTRSSTKIRFAQCLYRPFTKKYLYFDWILNERPTAFLGIFPTREPRRRTGYLWCRTSAAKAVSCLHSGIVSSDLHLCATSGGHQCFPFYIYDETAPTAARTSPTGRWTSSATHYNDPTITKWDIFHYVYGVLHHPGYREQFADNLKRELPRIPFAPDFRAFAEAGQAARRPPPRLREARALAARVDRERPTMPLSYRVEKMRLSKDKTALMVNDSLTLAGIPPEVFDYRLGNRSALDWVIDQYQVSEDKRSGITLRPQPRRRPGVHRPPRRPGRPRQHRDRQDRRSPTAGVWLAGRFRGVAGGATARGRPSKSQTGPTLSLICRPRPEPTPVAPWTQNCHRLLRPA